jgi:hypothetical protein
MDLATILSRVDAQQYSTPQEYLADFGLIVQVGCCKVQGVMAVVQRVYAASLLGNRLNAGVAGWVVLGITPMSP